MQVPNASIHFFISYASQDATVAAALVEALERHGVGCWIAPRDVKAGALYADAIRDPTRTAPPETPAVSLEASAATASAAHRKLRFTWIPLAAGTMFVVALAVLLADKFWISKHAAQEKPVATTSIAPAAGAPPQPTISENSVAVLPFMDMSEKRDQEYFADGLSEEILNLLAGIPTLRVIGRTSSFQLIPMAVWKSRKAASSSDCAA